MNAETVVDKDDDSCDHSIHDWGSLSSSLSSKTWRIEIALSEVKSWCASKFNIRLLVRHWMESEVIFCGVKCFM